MNSHYTSSSSPQMESRPPPDPTMALVFSIANFVCCCFPFGIVSIVYAVKMRQSLANDDIDGAYDADKKAKMWSLIGAVTGAISYLIFFVLIIAGGAMN